MKRSLGQVVEAIDGATFRKRFFNRIGAALFFIPTSGIVIMTYLGVYPWPDLLYVLIEYSGPVVAINVIAILWITGKSLDDIVDIAEAGTEAQKQLLGRRIKRRLPTMFFGITFLYTTQGALSANASLESFQGYTLHFSYYLYSMFGIVPTLLIVSFPVYLSLTDLLGKYLAPRGVRVVVAPMYFKYIILGLFTPLLIDTVLLLYYFDRTGYFSLETVLLWVGLLIIAAVGTLLAWRSMMQSLAPIKQFVIDAEKQPGIDVEDPVPQSLDEIGSIISRYADVMRKNRQIESDLSHERKFVNAVLENADALVVVLDREGHIIRFNRACEKLSGFAFDEVRGGYVWDLLLDPKEAEAVKTNGFEALAKHPEKLTGKYTNYWVNKAGQYFLIQWNNSVIFDADGNLDYVVSVGIDITDRQKAENALVENYQFQKSLLHLSQKLELVTNYEEVLQALSEEIQSTIGIAHHWLYICDEEDSRYCQMIGRVPDSLQPLQGIFDVVRLDMHDDDFLRYLQRNKDVIVVEEMSNDPRTDRKKNEALGIRTYIHVPFTFEDKWLGMFGLATFGDEGTHVPDASEMTYLQSISRQVSATMDRIHMIRQLQASKQLLEYRVEERTQELKDAQVELLRRERLSTLGQLTATVSHELRNPLAAMRPSTYILRKKLTEDEAAIRALERIERGINRCDHIIDELLDFTRITSLERSRQELDRWLAEVMQEQQWPGSLKVSLHCGLDGYLVDFDPHRLRRALINIIENAAQSFVADAEGKIAGNASIELSTQLVNDRVEIILKDNGPGIPADVLPHIFEPLFSTRNFGVGLGMPTVKQIMEQHEGGVEVQTIPGEGTTVTLWLPTHPSAADQLH